MLKKIITILITAFLTLLILFSVFACGDKPEVTTDTPSDTISPDSSPYTTAQAEISPDITTPPTTPVTSVPPSITPEPTTLPSTTPETFTPPSSTPETTPIIPEPEQVPGVPTLLSPGNYTLFPIGEEITLEWEAGEGGTPIGYTLEIQYTDPVEGARFGYWETNNSQTSNILTYVYGLGHSTNSKTISTAERDVGRWRVKAISQFDESDWSDWYYFGYGEPLPFVNTALITWKYARYYCFSPVEAGDMITIEAGFWSPLSDPWSWYVQLIDPYGNIERSWASCDNIPPMHVPCEDPSGLQVSHQVLQTGLYSIRVIVIESPQHDDLNVSIKVSPTNMDSLYFSSGNTNPGWHFVK